MKRAWLLLLPLMLIPLFFMSRDNRKTLIIFHAGSLTRPFEQLRRMFMADHPEIQVVCEGAGSRACCRKITDLARAADIVASADYLVIEDLLMPGHADWYLIFSRSRMVIAFGSHSKYAQEISADNWYEVLARPDVSFGHSDPDLDPAGYRTLLSWKLADLYYGRGEEDSIYTRLNSNCPPKNIRPGSMALIAVLQNFGLDYAYEYEAVAKQHHLQYISLPAELDLGSDDHADFYSKATVRVSGKKPGTHSTIPGVPVRYAVTILKKAENREAAELFVGFLLSDRGKRVFEENFQPVISPAVPNDPALIPQSLKNYCQ